MADFTRGQPVTWFMPYSGGRRECTFRRYLVNSQDGSFIREKTGQRMCYLDAADGGTMIATEDELQPRVVIDDSKAKEN